MKFSVAPQSNSVVNSALFTGVCAKTFTVIDLLFDKYTRSGKLVLTQAERIRRRENLRGSVQKRSVVSFFLYLQWIETSFGHIGCRGGQCSLVGFLLRHRGPNRLDWRPWLVLVVASLGSCGRSVLLVRN